MNDKQKLEIAIESIRHSRNTFKNMINWQLVPYNRSAPVLVEMQRLDNVLRTLEGNITDETNTNPD